MPNKPSKAIMAFMEKYGVESDEIWEVHGSTWVVKHKALERVAAEMGIKFDRPSVIACDMAAKSMVVCTSATLADKFEWSFGEASPANCKNAYFAAMAEKRSRDRVILKLLVCSGELYSDVDDIPEPKRANPHVTRPEDIGPVTEYDEYGEVIDNIPVPSPDSIKKLRVVDQRPIFEALQKEIQSTGTVAELQAWGTTNKDRLGSLKPDWQEFLRTVYGEHRDALRQLDKGDDMRMTG